MNERIKLFSLWYFSAAKLKIKELTPMHELLAAMIASFTEESNPDLGVGVRINGIPQPNLLSFNI
jgi:hypothetical protein